MTTSGRCTNDPPPTTPPSNLDRQNAGRDVHFLCAGWWTWRCRYYEMNGVDMSKETGGPAFPVTLLEGQTLGDGTANGMTLRDYFAAKAMGSLLELRHNDLLRMESDEFGGLNIVDNVGGTPDGIASECYAMADAMLEARK